jgi:ubiquinone/menaquinone biosynthesis C-methylase UbiE
MLEHLTFDEGAAFLRECRRVLKPGGVLRVLVPDAAALMTGWVTNTLGRFDELSPQAAARATSAGKLYELLCAEHRAIYDAETLVSALKQAGFSRGARAAFGQSESAAIQKETIDLYPDLSLIAEGVR